MEHRLAQIRDIPDIMQVIAEAQAFLAEQGLDQWQNGYPDSEVFSKDIARGECNVFFDGSGICGVAVISLAHEPTYDVIYEGEWRGGDCVVIHRSAVAARARRNGVMREIFALAEETAKACGRCCLRADTHEGNLPMQRALVSAGFEKRGVIYLAPQEGYTTKRLAYEKLL